MNDQVDRPNESQKVAGQLIPAAQTVPAITDPYGYFPGYGQGETDGVRLFGLTVFDYWRFLNKHKWLILSIAAAFIAIAAIRTLMQTPLYTSSVRLEIEREAKILQAGDVMPQVSEVQFMHDQTELVKSGMMAERVASALRLGQDPDFIRPRNISLLGSIRQLFRPAKPSHGDVSASKAKAASIVAANVGVNSVPLSRMIDVYYTDPNPSRAQKIADAFADAFVATNQDKRFQANASAKLFLEDKIQQLKGRLEESERKMLAFAEKQQIVNVTDKESIAEANLGRANSELGTLISERTKNEQLWKQLEASHNAIYLPQLLSNGAIDRLRTQRDKLAVEYQEKAAIFKPSYPEMVQIDNQIKQIDKQLASEVNTIKSSLKAGYEASLAEEQAAQERVDALKKDLLDLQKRSVEYNILKREVDTNRDLYTSLLQRYKEVDVASGVGVNNVFVVDKAYLPSAPSSPNLRRALLVALVLGLLIGSALAFALELIDDKVRSTEQLESIASLPVLGVIPKVRAVESQAADPRSALSEAYRSLCTALTFSTEHGLPKSLLITSSGPAEGKSLTSLSIAKHFARMGRRVLLIDADLRNPSLHRTLNRDNSIGLSNYLTGGCTPPEAMQKTELPNLAYMASGPLPPNAADLLASARVHSLLSIGAEVFDLIVIDGPPVLGLADAQLLASAAAATIFVASAGQVRTAHLRGALRHLRLSRGFIIGAAMTKYDSRADNYQYAYDYNYGYGYGNETAESPGGLSVTSSGSEKPLPQLTDTHETIR
jgi:succinoglycan biosynthesis transport protein ExoP